MFLYVAFAVNNNAVFFLCSFHLQVIPACKACVQWGCQSAGISEDLQRSTCQCTPAAGRINEAEPYQLQGDVWVQLSWAGSPGRHLPVSSDHKEE